MLTEEQIARTWRQLFKRDGITEETIARAEDLLEQIRPESPLRHRLGSELEEIRRVHKVGA